MADWLELPAEPLKFQPYQDAFWKARRQRICRTCKIEFDAPPHPRCPQCGDRGVRKFHRCCLLSGRRGGKTRAGAIAGTEESTLPNTIGWACAPTNEKLHRYVIPAFQQVIPNKWVLDYSAEHHDLLLKNGSLIHFQTLEHPDQGRGQGLDWLWIDEVCELTLQHWEVIRPSLTERRGLAIFTSSPHGYDWVYEQFYLRARDGVPGYWTTRYKTSDNPIITTEEIDEAKATMTGTMFRQEYEADFVIFEGAVYTSDSGSLVDPQILRTDDEIRKLIPEWPDIAPWRQALVGIDTGADHPFGAVKLVATERGLVVVGEYLSRDKTFIQHANAMKVLASPHPTKWALNKNERQPSLELAQHGIYAQRAENEIVAGTERVKSWLIAKQLYFIQALCPRTIQQMSSYHWAKPTTRDGQLRNKEKVFKLNDELPDCIRYALMTWPVLPKALPEDTNKLRDITKLPGEMQASIERMRRLDGRKPEKESTVLDFWG